MSTGVLYIAFGKKYVEEAIRSAHSLKAFSPGLSVSLFTDAECGEKIFDEVRQIEVKHRRTKVDYLKHSPYERTLYLDSDTKVLMDISEAFRILDRFDVAATQSIGRKNPDWSRKVPEYDEICYAFPEYNGGVIFYRHSEQVENLFDIWNDKFYRYQKESNGRDQLSFRIALWLSDCRIHTLGPEYNVRSAAHRQRVEARRIRDGDTTLQPRILHWHGVHRKRFLNFSAKDRPYKF